MSKLAIFGGTPVRSEPYPGWPTVSEKDEQGIAQVYLSGKWSKGEVAAPSMESF